jgi:hypothetical protein
VTDDGVIALLPAIKELAMLENLYLKWVVRARPFAA